MMEEYDMPEQHAADTDRIDELLGSLQESRTVHGPSAAPPAAPRHRQKSIWIGALIVLVVVGVIVALLMQGRTATLNIRSFPSGGTAFLDGTQAGTTPLVLTRVAPGTHNIQIRLSGWEDWNGTATAVKGSTTQIIANLKHAAYSLVITSTPPGASVTLDGADKGITPLTIASLRPRNYSLVVSLKGYNPISRTVDLSDTTQGAQDFTLQQAFGKIAVTSDPAGAQVLIDDKPCGVTPLKLDSFPVGDYSLTLKLAGSKDITDKVTVMDGAIFTKQYKFDRALGELTISTDPAGASITIDGKTTGKTTPSTLSDLPEGTHEIYLELPGYLPWSGESSVNKGETSQLTIALTKLH